MKIVSTMGEWLSGAGNQLGTLVSELENHLGEIIDTNFRNTAMATVRLEENGPAYTIYRTGTLQIRGGETEELLIESFRRFEEVLDEISVDAS